MMSMHVWHGLSFAKPEVSNVLSFLSPKKDLNAIHFISENCSCSTHLINHLIERGHSKKVHEKVIVLGNLRQEKKQLEKAGYEIERISYQEAYENEYFAATPLFVVFDMKKNIKYMGGYTQNTITPLSKIYDTEIFEIAANEKNVAKDFPIKGCANSKKIQKLIDPFGLKYRRRNEFI